MSEDQAKTSDLQIIIQGALQWYHDLLTNKMGPFKYSEFREMMRLDEMRKNKSNIEGLLFAIDEQELFRLIFDNGLFMAACDALEAKNVTLERFVYELRDKGLLQKDDPDFITNEEAEYRLNCDVRRWLWAMRNKNQPTSKAADQQQAAAPAADQEPKTPGRKEKLSMDMFMREIFPDMKLMFPDSKHVAGKKAYCEAVGKTYGVSEKTIRDKFDTCNNNRGETM